MNIKQQSLKDIIKNSLNRDINAQDCLIKRFNAKLWKLSYQIDKENAEGPTTPSDSPGFGSGR